jgi:MFS family permease
MMTANAARSKAARQRRRCIMPPMRFGPLRLHYFILFTLMGAYLPFMPLYLRQLALADWQIGWAMGISGLAVLIAPLALTHLADRHWSNRRLIGLTAVGAMAALLVLASLGPTTGGAAHFPLVLGVILCFALNHIPCQSLLDGLTFATIHEAEARGEPHPSFPTIRIMGSYGFIAPAFFLLPAFAYLPVTYRLPVLVGAGCALIGAINSRRLPKFDGKRGEELEQSKRTLPSIEAWRVIFSPPTRTIVGSMLLIHTAISAYYAFFSRLLEQLHVDAQWIGLISNIGVAAEVVVVLFAGPILRAVGLRGVVTIGTLSMVLRMTLLAIPLEGAAGQAVAIASQVLHGPIVLLLYFVVPMYMNHKAGPRFRNSMQGLNSFLAFGVGRLVGSVGSGYIAQVDLRLAFAAAAGLSFVAAAWALAAFRDDEACAVLGRVQPMEAEHEQENLALQSLTD